MLVLTVAKGPDRGAKFELRGKNSVIIGRNSTDLKLSDIMISRYHARLKEVDGRWYVRDLGSRNGTKLNGERLLRTQALREGDLIATGLTVLEFHVVPDPADKLAPVNDADDSAPAIDDEGDESIAMTQLPRAGQLPAEPLELDIADEPPAVRDVADDHAAAPSSAPLSSDAPAHQAPVDQVDEQAGEAASMPRTPHAPAASLATIAPPAPVAPAEPLAPVASLASLAPAVPAKNVDVGLVVGSESAPVAAPVSSVTMAVEAAPLLEPATSGPAEKAAAPIDAAALAPTRVATEVPSAPAASATASSVMASIEVSMELPALQDLLHPVETYYSDNAADMDVALLAGGDIGPSTPPNMEEATVSQVAEMEQAAKDPVEKIADEEDVAEQGVAEKHVANSVVAEEDALEMDANGRDAVAAPVQFDVAAPVSFAEPMTTDQSHPASTDSAPSESQPNDADQIAPAAAGAASMAVGMNAADFAAVARPSGESSQESAGQTNIEPHIESCDQAMAGAVSGDVDVAASAVSAPVAPEVPGLTSLEAEPVTVSSACEALPTDPAAPMPASIAAPAEEIEVAAAITSSSPLSSDSTEPAAVVDGIQPATVPADPVRGGEQAASEWFAAVESQFQVVESQGWDVEPGDDDDLIGLSAIADPSDASLDAEARQRLYWDDDDHWSDDDDADISAATALGDLDLPGLDGLLSQAVDLGESPAPSPVPFAATRSRRINEAGERIAARDFAVAEGLLLALQDECPTDPRSLEMLVMLLEFTGRRGDAGSLLESRLREFPRDAHVLQLASLFHDRSRGGGSCDALDASVGALFRTLASQAAAPVTAPVSVAAAPRQERHKARSRRSPR